MLEINEKQFHNVFIISVCFVFFERKFNFILLDFGMSNRHKKAALKVSLSIVLRFCQFFCRVTETSSISLIFCYLEWFCEWLWQANSHHFTFEFGDWQPDPSSTQERYLPALFSLSDCVEAYFDQLSGCAHRHTAISLLAYNEPCRQILFHAWEFFRSIIAFMGC